MKTCINCGRPFAVVFNASNPIMIDPEPVEDGELVLRGDPGSCPDGEFVAAFYGVGPEGDEFWGVPAGAPRYREHVCDR